ncbi:MAG: hypothetical protein ACLGJB_20690 [Blastocatellia bacterium]
MRFSKPINREVDIDGDTFVVSFDDSGIDFRLKGKRRTAHADWVQVLNVARGEQGANAREFLGVGSGHPQQGDQAERLEHVFESHVSATGGAQAQASRANQPQGAESTSREEMGRAVTAGEVGSES